MGTEPDPFFPLVGRGSFTMVRSDIAGRVAATLRTAKAGPGTAPAAPGRKSSAGATGASAKRSLSFGGFEARAVARDKRKQQMVEAEAWCEKTGKGAKACLAVHPQGAARGARGRGGEQEGAVGGARGEEGGEGRDAEGAFRRLAQVPRRLLLR